MAAPVMSERERETAADKRLYLDLGFVPVQCRACDVEVGVKKNSPKHTSVQWTCDAVVACRELADQQGRLRLGCRQLKDSIERAVLDGAIVVPDA